MSNRKDHMQPDLNARLAAILERHPMTAREKMEAMYRDEYQSDDILADRLIAIIDKRIQEVAELREKERGDHAGEPNEMIADEWVPTEQQIMSVLAPAASNKLRHSEFYTEASQMRWDSVRAGMLAGHRIAKESQCSNTSSAVSSPRVSFSSATTSTEAEHTAVATKPVAPTESSTPSPKSGAKSLDERAEAIFAKWPELRPDDFRFEIALADGVWRWRNKETKEFGSLRNPQDQCRIYILGKLLPRAIERWWSRTLLQQGQCFIDSRKGAPPSDLESAIRVLEGK